MKHIVVLAISILAGAPSYARAQDIVGNVVGADGSPISGAIVVADGNGTHNIVRTDRTGTFAMPGVRDGIYTIRAQAKGYGAAYARVVRVDERAPTAITLQLDRANASLATIGSVRTRAYGESISTSSAPSVDLNAQHYASEGYASVADILAQEAVAASVVRPAGGSAGPVAIALRGPDPTETLVDVDGHPVNSAGTGTFDLSLLDPAMLGSVQLAYGIAPSSLVGPNTIGGAINIRTLEPTERVHGLLRLSYGSSGTFAQTIASTGTSNGVGYAFALHALSSSTSGSLAGSSSLAKLRIPIERGAGFVALSMHGQSTDRDLSSAMPQFDGSAMQTHGVGYGFDAEMPLGRIGPDGIARTTVLLRHYSLLSNQSVSGTALGSTPYLNDDRDVLTDDTAQFDRATYRGTFTFKLGIRSERLDLHGSQSTPEDQFVHRRPPLGLQFGDLPVSTTMRQVQRSAVLRYALDPTAALHYALALYYSNFSSFGTSLDPRFGFVWTPNASNVLRFSLGTTFQSPQLPELYVPATLPAPGADGYVTIGNPNLRADHATDIDLGFEHIFSGKQPFRAGVDLYRTNLRGPAQRLYPQQTCPPADASGCISYPVNVGAAVYRGIELTLDRSIGPTTTLHAAYGINNAFTASITPATQGGSIVPGQQMQGVPLRKGVFDIRHHVQRGVSYSLGVAYEDKNNDLNRPAFATVRAGFELHARAYDVGVYGTNLTNTFNDRFTLAGKGTPYSGTNGPIATNAYSLPGPAVQLVVTRSF